MDIDAAMSVLWRNALAAVPLALIVAACCRLLPLKPATRHAMWCLVLLVLLTPPVLPELGLDLAQSAARGLVKASWNPGIPSRIGESTPADRSEPVHASVNPPRDARSETAEPGGENRSSNVEVHNQRDLPVSNLDIDAPAAWTPAAAWKGSPIPFGSGLGLPAPRPAAEAAAKGDSTFNFDQAAAPTPPRTALDADPLQPNLASSSSSSSSRAAEAHAGAAPAQPQAAASMSLRDDSGSTSALKDWMLRLAQLREALVNVPPLPPVIWVTGILTVLAILLARVVCFRWLMRCSTPAPPCIHDMVAALASQMGLRGVPQTLTSDRRIAPMVWCGRSPRLILPIDLWNELDGLGRRAVIMHELAHLRRHDHWICWLGMLVGLAYWWHPLVWWCRRQIREQADLSCDAWVTALMPYQRRAYAQALLCTQRFISEGTRRGWPACGFGLGLAISTPHAKRFARRLTMVMTARSRPRMSRVAIASLCLLAGGTFLTTPLWACPPESQPTLKQTVKARQKSPGERHVVVIAPPAAPAPPQDLTPAPGSTFEQYMHQRHAGPGGGGTPPPDNLEQRLNQLEHRLNQLTEQLHQVLQHQPQPAPGAPGARGMGGMGGGGGSGGGAYGGARGEAAIELALPRARARAELAAPGQPAGRADAADGAEIVRVYSLPEGKLEALINLMARSDVPVFIERVDNGIKVHGTPHQHEIFRAFIDLIHPEGRHESRAGSLEGLYALRAEQLAAAERLGDFRLLAEVAGEDVECVQTRAAALAGMHEHLWRAVEQLYQREAELEAQAEAMDDQASALDEQAQSLLALAEERTDEGRHSLRAQAEALIAQAQALADQGRALDEASREVEDQAERAESEAEAAAEAAEEAAESAAHEAAEDAEEAQDESQSR